MGVLKPYLITVFLLVVIVDVALARYYYRWFRFGRFQRTLKRCNKQSILDKLCPEVPEDDPCANIDCSCNGQCEDGVCNCDLGFTGDNCENDACANIDCSCNGQCENGMCTCDPGFTGENCDSEDFCALSEFCLNGGTCENNRCTCSNIFIGERCQLCTLFRTIEIGFDNAQFSIDANPVPSITSCTGLCDVTVGCTGSIIFLGGCRLFGSPVLDVIDLSPEPGPTECQVACQNNEDCRTAVLDTFFCFLLTVPAADAVSQFGNTVVANEKQCDNPN